MHTQVYCEASGVIAAVVFGLFGSATTLWGMSPAAKSSGAFHQFWEGVTFALNGVVSCFTTARRGLTAARGALLV